MLILQVPIYIVAQLLGSVLASGSLYLIFDVKDEAFFGTIPVGTNVQSFVLEIIISFLLMFVISGVATDNRSVSQQSTLILFSLIFKKKKNHSYTIDVSLADWRTCRNCYWNDNTIKRIGCRVP